MIWFLGPTYREANEAYNRAEDTGLLSFLFSTYNECGSSIRSIQGGLKHIPTLPLDTIVFCGQWTDEMETLKLRLLPKHSRIERIVLGTFANTMEEWSKT